MAKYTLTHTDMTMGTIETWQFDTLYQVSEWFHNMHWWGKEIGLVTLERNPDG